MDRTNYVTVAFVIVALAITTIVITAPNQFVKAQQPSKYFTVHCKSDWRIIQ
ncbi:MAG: hypothetical protein ACRD8Z_07975 [Nitrososphaeraceae archaeon]